MVSPSTQPPDNPSPDSWSAQRLCRLHLPRPALAQTPSPRKLLTRVPGTRLPEKRLHERESGPDAEDPRQFLRHGRCTHDRPMHRPGSRYGPLGRAHRDMVQVNTQTGRVVIGGRRLTSTHFSLVSQSSRLPSESQRKQPELVPCGSLLGGQQTNRWTVSLHESRPPAAFSGGPVLPRSQHDSQHSPTSS